jgi:hypothetical protein
LTPIADIAARRSNAAELDIVELPPKAARLLIGLRLG